MNAVPEQPRGATLNLAGCLGIVLLLAAAGAPAGAAQTFSDSTFLTGWTSAPMQEVPPTATFSVTVVTNGAAPHPTYRQVNHDNYSLILVAHLNTLAVWNPASQGAISSIDYSYSIENFSYWGTGYSILLMQNGKYYSPWSYYDLSTPTWNKLTHTGADVPLTAYLEVTPGGGSGPGQPDFSSSGAPITFGYETGNSTTSGTGSTSSALTDWQVTVNPAARNLVFTPIQPCRIVDTRAGSGLQGDGTGPLVAGTPVAYQVAGLCGLPSPAAKAAVLNFVAVSPQGPGHLIAWPWDSVHVSPPNASVLNYAAVAGLNIANGLLMTICDPGTASGGICAKDLFVQPTVSAAHLVVDVVGYFTAAPTVSLSCAQSFTPWSAAVGAGFSVTASCPSGQPAGGGYHTSQSLPSAVSLTTLSPVASGFLCEGTNQAINDNATTWTGQCFANCCQVTSP
jgi:hypothetical protein